MFARLRPSSGLVPVQDGLDKYPSGCVSSATLLLGCRSKSLQATRTKLDFVGQSETPPVRGSHCEGGTPACTGTLSSNHGSRGLRLLSADGSSTDSVRVIDAEPFHPQGMEAREWRFTAYQCQTS